MRILVLLFSLLQLTHVVSQTVEDRDSILQAQVKITKTNLFAGDIESAEKDINILMEKWEEHKDHLSSSTRKKLDYEIRILRGGYFFEKDNFNLAKTTYLNLIQDLNQDRSLNENSKIIEDNLTSTHFNLAYFYTEFGNYNEALYHCDNALLLQPFNENIYSYYSKIHIKREEYELARDYAIKSLKAGVGKFDTLIREDQRKRHKMVIELHYSVVDSHTKLREFKEAREILKQSLKYYEKEEPISPIYYKYLGKIYLAEKELAAARFNFREGLALIKKNANSSKHLFSQLYTYIGDTYSQEGNYSQALENYQTAIFNLSNDKNLSTDFTEKVFYQSPPLDQIAYPTDFIEITAKKVQILFLYPQERNEFRKIRLLCETAIDYLESTRLNYSAGKDRQHLLSKSYEIYEAAITLSLELGELDKAYEFSERSRAMLMKDAFQKRRLNYLKKIDPLLSAREDHLKKQRSKYSINIHNEQDATKRDSLKKEKLKVEKALIAVRDSFPKDDKTIQVTFLPIDTIQKRLEEGQTCLQYFEGEKHIYAFLIPKDSAIQYHIIPRTDRLVKDINTLNRLIEKGDESFLDPAYHIYSELIAPLFKNDFPKHLFIIPDGNISQIPFCALLVSEPSEREKGQYQHHDYLNNHLSISYGYSATSLFEDRLELVLTSFISFAGFAPKYSGGTVAMRSVLSDLKYNATEIEAIFNYLKGQKKWIGETATKANFLKFIRKADPSFVLHLAMHGKANPLAPQFSRVIFSLFAKEGGTELYAEEILNYSIRFRMIVLSACETGVGKKDKGEGSISLGRAFRYAGVQSVVMTLWSINDKSTADIMTLFYQELQKGKSKSEALREAQLIYLKDEGEKFDTDAKGHPKYWAAFTAIGDIQPLVNNEISVWVWIVLGLLLCFLNPYFLKK